ncbi:MAG: replication-associated recombination protein A [Candidatus Omnitrophica bacterium]|nr:replication-associated recombination protein A [Candidatus Omnitrophota bacterium]
MSSKSDLFIDKCQQGSKPVSAGNIQDTPLANRMRPRNLEEFTGQQHILGKDKLLRRLIDSDRISSIMLYGSPGTGKSALGFIISNITHAYFETIYATSSGVADVKKAIQQAKIRKNTLGQKTILFIDEIHRFNKAQQDVLINDVESGNIILIGATTHNPFFYIIPALISRSHVFEFKPHTKEDLLVILKNALSDEERGLGKIGVAADEAALEHLCQASDGDARRALNALEVAALTTPPDKAGKVRITKEVAQESIQKKIVRYDHDGDDHYDVISAFIKSMRGTDPDAALYWLAKMLYAGEDPRFIARRIIICAAEDVGNADPQALVVAVAAFNAAELVGMPEARIPLAQAAVYVACAPKSNAAYLGIEKATKDVDKNTAQEVPQHLKDASYLGAQTLGRGSDYKYAHEYTQHYVKQKYMDNFNKYYFPTEMGFEKKIKEWLLQLKKK